MGRRAANRDITERKQLEGALRVNNEECSGSTRDGGSRVADDRIETGGQRTRARSGAPRRYAEDFAKERQ